MKKNTTAKQSSKALTTGTRKGIRQQAATQRLTIGLDLGDRTSRYCILNEAGEKISEGALPTTKTGLDSLFAKMPASRIALEVGTHSPWMSRQLAKLGHEVIIANPRKVRLITHSVRKNDRIDAEQLARLARVDPKLLSPIQHRGEQAQADLAVIRARAELMEARTQLVNCVRGLVKPLGERMKKCDADQVGESLAEPLSEEAQTAILPLLKSVKAISEQLQEYNQLIENIAKRYPEVELLTAIHGVGRLIALTFILTIEKTERFEHSRDVGAFVGLQPRQHESGDSQPELGISKAGDKLLRSYLVQAAHGVLRKGAPDCDLREWALGKLNQPEKESKQKAGNSGRSKGKCGSGKKAKKRMVVAVARKLAVLMHRLWSAGEVYDPHYNQKRNAAA